MGRRVHELFGFQVNDRVICPSGKRAVIVRFRTDGKFDALYVGEDEITGKVTLDARHIQHAEDGEWVS